MFEDVQGLGSQTTCRSSRKDMTPLMFWVIPNVLLVLYDFPVVLYLKLLVELCWLLAFVLEYTWIQLYNIDMNKAYIHNNYTYYTIYISANILVKFPILLGLNQKPPGAQGLQTLLVRAFDLGESFGSCACRRMEARFRHGKRGTQGLLAVTSGILPGKQFLGRFTQQHGNWTYPAW